jgi:hypothetical protein
MNPHRVVAKYLAKQAGGVYGDPNMDYDVPENMQSPVAKAIEADKKVVAKIDNTLIKWVNTHIRPLLQDPDIPEEMKDKLQRGFIEHSIHPDEALSQNSIRAYAPQGTDSSCSRGETWVATRYSSCAKGLDKKIKAWEKLLKERGYHHDWLNYDAPWSEMYAEARAALRYMDEVFLNQDIPESSRKTYSFGWNGLAREASDLIKAELTKTWNFVNNSVLESVPVLKASAKRILLKFEELARFAEKAATESCGAYRKLWRLYVDWSGMTLADNKAKTSFASKYQLGVYLKAFEDRVSAEMDKVPVNDPRYGDLSNVYGKIKALRSSVETVTWGWVNSHDKPSPWGFYFTWEAEIENLLKTVGYLG